MMPCFPVYLRTIYTLVSLLLPPLSSSSCLGHLMHSSHLPAPARPHSAPLIPSSGNSKSSNASWLCLYWKLSLCKEPHVLFGGLVSFSFIPTRCRAMRPYECSHSHHCSFLLWYPSALHAQDIRTSGRCHSPHCCYLPSLTPILVASAHMLPS